MEKIKIEAFVRESATQLFRRQSKTTYDEKDKDALVDTANLIIIVSKSMVLRRYPKYWAKQLQKCVNTLDKEVDVLEAAQNDLKWPQQKSHHDRTILKPKQIHLKQAKHDAQKMAALIQYWQDN